MDSLTGTTKKQFPFNMLSKVCEGEETEKTRTWVKIKNLNTEWELSPGEFQPLSHITYYIYW